MDLSPELEVKLRALARSFAGSSGLYDDLLQEARLGALRAARLPQARTEAWILRAARWALLRYLARERRQICVSLDTEELIGADFVPALLDVLSEEVPAAIVPTVDRPALTLSEHTVLDWLCRGQDRKEIAATLGIGARTVETHLSNIYRKLGVRNAVQAFIAALVAGLVDPPV